MSIRSTIKGTRGISKAITLVLVVLYMAGTFNPEIFHSMVHDHDKIATHSKEQESNACHRSIYHHDVEHGCDHDSHLVDSDDCQMFDLAFHGDQNIVINHVFNTVKFSSEHFDRYKIRLDSYWAVISSSRAPPFVGYLI